jgi:FAD/FMN-containing dehydrogenase
VFVLRYLIVFLTKATIVTADGSTLTVSSSENTDLFWGIRGGGSNFGVCTEFVLKLHPQRPTVFAGMVMFPPPALDTVSSAVKQWWTKGPPEKAYLLLIMLRSPDGKVSCPI